MENKSTFILHYRQIPDWLKQSPTTFHLLAEFARRTRREEGKVEWNGEIINLHSRQFITGRNKVSKVLGISEGKYRSAYRMLTQSRLIQTIRATKRYTIGKYCADSIFNLNLPNVIPSEKPSDLPSANQLITTNKKDNNIEEIWNYYLLCSKTKELLTPTRRLKIKTRLKTFTQELIKEAIKNCFNDSFYNGEKNDRGWRANADFMFRSDEIIDRFLSQKPKPQDWHEMPDGRVEM